MKNKELSQIVKRVQKGDPNAFEALYNATFNVVYYYCHTHLKHEEVEDAVQEVYLKVYTRINEIKNPEAFNKFLSLFMIDICTERYKKRASAEEVDIDEMADILNEDNINFLPEEMLESNEIREKLRDAIDRLPPKQKQSLILYYYQDLSVQDICDVTGRNRSAVLNNLHLARKNICSELGVELNEEAEGRSKNKMMAFMPFMFEFFEAEAASVALPFKAQIWQGVSAAVQALPPPSSGGAGSSVNPASAGASVAGKAALAIGASAVVAISSFAIYNQLNERGLDSSVSNAIQTSSAFSSASEHSSMLESSLSERPADSEAIEEIAEDIFEISTIDEYDTYCQMNGFQALSGESESDGAVYYTSGKIISDGTVILIGARDTSGHVEMAYEQVDALYTPDSAKEWFQLHFE